MPTPLAPTANFQVHFTREGRSRKASAKPRRQESDVQTIPRQVKLLALAHHLDGLLRQGVFADYADIARVSGLTRARITQIMGLLLLAPEIQEQMLNTPECARGLRDRDMQRVVAEVDWIPQVTRWHQIQTKYGKVVGK